MKSRAFFSVATLPGIILIFFLFAFSGCKSQPDAIFLITLDTTRADQIDYSPVDNSQTPNLAKLANQGQYFVNAYAAIPITLPSHASMFYSLPPHRLKLYNNGQIKKIHWPSVTQLLKGNGYFTGAVISLGVLKGEFGLNKGFDRYIENFKPYSWMKTAEQVNQDAFGMIDDIINQNPKQKYFFWIHYSDPHEPYFPPQTSGTFRIFFNEEELFSAPASAQPIVNVQFALRPGENTLVFNTELSPIFNEKSQNKVEFSYIKYQDFFLKPKDKEKNKDSLLEVIIPQNWNNKTTREEIDYYADRTQAEIRVLNRGQQPLLVTMRFIYSLWVDDASRKRLYREEVKYMDRQLGELLNFLKKKGIYDDSVFLIMGDHGEGLGEYRNHYGHIHYLNKEAVHVPLIISGKGIKPSGKRPEPVSNLNVAPTLLELAGLEKSPYMQGQSLLNPLKPARLLLATYSPEAYFDAFSLIDFPYQVCFYPGRVKEKIEFYNLELSSQGTIKKGEEKIRTKLINALLKISRIITATKGKPGGVAERHKEILKSLGYL